MKVLITGVTGFIARELALALLKKNYEVVGLTRGVKKNQPPPPCPFWEWKNCHDPLPAKAFENTTAVIHLAGESIFKKRWSKKQKQVLTNSRVKTAEKLIEECRRCSSIETFISAGAVGFYGCRKDEKLDEASPKGTGFLPQLCSQWEQSVLSFKDSNSRLVVFRMGVVLSSKGGMLKQLLPVFKWGAGSVFSSGSQWMSWIDLDDLIQLFITALENKNWTGVFNAVSPCPATNKEFSLALGKTLNRPVFLTLPKILLKIVFGEMSRIFLDSQRVLPAKAQKKGFVFRYSQLESSLRRSIKNTH